MARLNVVDAKSMAEKNGGFDFKFFSIKDRETIKIRFLISKIEDVESFSVHTITMPDGKKKNVSCLRQPNEPVQNCPLCSISNRARARIYLNVVDEKTHDLLIWERSAQFLDTLEGYINRYGDLRDYIFEVERKGSGLDTEYIIYPLGQSIIEDKSVLPQPVSVLGKSLLDKNFNDLTVYVNTGNLPDDNQPVGMNNQDIQRRESTPQPNYGAPQNQAPNYTMDEVNPWGDNNNNQTPPKRNGWN